jgi:hypothetical protein
MYSLLFIIIPALLMHYGNQFYSIKTKIGQLPVPGAQLVPVSI